MIKRLFITWLQGFENAPYLVNECLASWKCLNPSWKVHEIDNCNLKEWLPDLEEIEVFRASYSDIIRINLLNKYGGLWVDATTFCNKSLDLWLDKYVQYGFFCFSNPGPDRLISSWFIYADLDNYIIKQWLNKVTLFWSIKDRTYEYFWFHYIFGELYLEDEKVNEIWNNIPYLEANGNNGPHYIQEVNILGLLTNEIKDCIDSKNIPLFKLNHRVE